MTEHSGLLTQTDDDILGDLEEFFFGNAVPWLISIKRNRMQPGLLTVTLWDPDEEEETRSRISKTIDAADIKNAFLSCVTAGYDVCCKGEIMTERLGAGCVQDLDLIVQTACYGRIHFG